MKGKRGRKSILWEIHENSADLFRMFMLGIIFSSVGQLCRLLVTPWTAACQASLSITNSWSLFKLMSIELAMPFNHLILCHPFSSSLQPFPAAGSFQMSQFCTSHGQSIGVSASESVFQWIFRLISFRVDWLDISWLNNISWLGIIYTF